MTTYAEKMMAWIEKHLDEGRTVTAANYLTQIRISPKHRDLIRLSKDRKHVEVLRGRAGWESIIGCKISAS